MKSLSKLTLTAWTATSLLASAVFTQADLLPENFLPENTLAVASVRNIQRDWDQFQQTPFALMLKDPAMQPFMNYLNNTINVYWNQFKPILEAKQIDLNEYTPFFNHFSGGVTFALISQIQDISEVQDGKDILDSLFPCLILETTGDTAQIQNEFGKLKSKITELVPEIHVNTQTVGGVEYTTFSPDKDFELWIWFKNNRCVVCPIFIAPEELKKLTREKLLEEVKADQGGEEAWNNIPPEDQKELIDRRDGIRYFQEQNVERCRARRIKNTERAKAILASIFSDAPSYPALANAPEFTAHTTITVEQNYLFLNFKPLKEFIKQGIQELDKKYKLPEDKMAAIMYPPKPSVIYDELGIEAFKSLSYTWSSQNGEPNVTLTLSCPEDERKGLSALINSYVPGDCSPLPQVPDNTLSFSRCHIDPVQFWTTLDTTTSRTIGGMKGMGVGFIQAFLMQDAQINLKQNVLENLTGDFITWKTSYEKQEDGKLSNEGVILIGAKDSGALLSTLGAIYNLIIPMIAKDQNIDKTCFALQEKESNGTKIFSIPLPQRLPENYANNPHGLMMSTLMQLPPLFALPEFNFAAVEGYLIFATRIASIENFISNAKTSEFSNKEGIPEAAEKIGGLHQCSFFYGNMSFCYQYVGHVLDIVMKEVENNLKANPSNEPIDPRKIVLSAWNLLPKNGELLKYISYNITTSNVTPEGVQWKSNMPWPKQLEVKKQ